MKLKVGQTVRIDPDFAKQANVSSVATVEMVDEDCLDLFPYRLCLSNGHCVWVPENCIMPANTSAKVI